MNPNIKHTERIAVLATIDPVSQAPGAVATGWVPAAQFHSLAAMIQTGVLGASATVDAKLQQATDSTGTGVKDIPGKSLTQILKASGDNKQAFIELQGTDLDGNNGYGFVRLSVTVGAAASLIAAQLLGTNPRYVPASGSNQAGVVQIV